MKQDVYFSLGSNVGDSINTLKSAVSHMSSYISNIKVSSVYKTKPCYKEDQADFFNIAIFGQTSLEPLELLNRTQETEAFFGRNRKLEEFKGPRTLDIDILIYGCIQFHTDRLSIPHIGMLERAFVLVPLTEIAPSVCYPGTTNTFSDLLKNISTEGIYLLEDTKI